jgi:AraC family transcriptional regulator, melibiose operon regulatory protein
MTASYAAAERFSSRFPPGFFSNFNVVKSPFQRRGTVSPSAATDYLPATGFMVLRRNPRYKMTAAHTHSNIELNFLQGGRLVYLHGGVRRTVEAGRVAMFWAGVPHQTISAGELADGIWIQLPLAWVLQWKPPRDLAGRLLAGEFFQFEFAPELPERWLRDFTSGDEDSKSVLLLELQALFARLALTLPAAARPAPSSANANIATGGDQHISRVTAFIAGNYHNESLTIGDIARVVNLRPHYLTTLFKRHCHVGLWEYVTRLRVSHAQRLLVTSDLRVLDVALESGFSSLAPFYNAFGRYCGMRPLVFRKRRGEPAPTAELAR